jgi:hypothetical protein
MSFKREVSYAYYKNYKQTAFAYFTKETVYKLYECDDVLDESVAGDYLDEILDVICATGLGFNDKSKLLSIYTEDLNKYFLTTNHNSKEQIEDDKSFYADSSDSSSDDHTQNVDLSGDGDFSGFVLKFIYENINHISDSDVSELESDFQYLSSDDDSCRLKEVKRNTATLWMILIARGLGLFRSQNLQKQRLLNMTLTLG